MQPGYFYIIIVFPQSSAKLANTGQGLHFYSQLKVSQKDYEELDIWQENKS